MSKMQRIILYTIAGCFLAILIILLGLIYEYRYRRRIRAEREQQARLVAKQQQQLEHMTVELEQTKVSQSQDELFMQRLQDLIEKHINNSNLSIEMISDKIGVSRTQLFRKTKALTGITYRTHPTRTATQSTTTTAQKQCHYPRDCIRGWIYIRILLRQMLQGVFWY